MLAVGAGAGKEVSNAGVGSAVTLSTDMLQTEEVGVMSTCQEHNV